MLSKKNKKFMKGTHVIYLLFLILCSVVFSCCSDEVSPIIDINELSGIYTCDVGYYQEDSSGVRRVAGITNVELEVLETGDKTYLIKVEQFSPVATLPDSIITIPHLTIKLTVLEWDTAYFMLIENGCYTSTGLDRFQILGRNSDPNIRMELKCTKPNSIFRLHIFGRKI